MTNSGFLSLLNDLVGASDFDVRGAAERGHSPFRSPTPHLRNVYTKNDPLRAANINAERNDANRLAAASAEDMPRRIENGEWYTLWIAKPKPEHGRRKWSFSLDVRDESIRELLRRDKSARLRISDATGQELHIGRP